MSEVGENNANEPVVKKRSGNPNFQKGKKNVYYDKDNKPMSDNASPDAGTNEQPAETTTAQQPQATAQTNTGATEPAKPDNSSPLTGDGKKVIPDDAFMFDEHMPGETIPLDGEVEKKDYGTLKDATPGNGNPSGAPLGGASGTATDGSGTPPPVNPFSTGESAMGGGGAPMPGKSPEEIQNEAEQAVDLMLKGYEKMHDFGRFLSKKDEQKLAADHATGKVNLNYTFPLSKGAVSIKQIVGDYNKSIEESIVVTDDFVKNVKPKLVRIAIKRGWGLSDEMAVGAYLVDDLATKIGLLVGLNKSINMILNIGYESMKENKAGVATPAAAPPKQDANDNLDNWRDENIKDAEIVP